MTQTAASLLIVDGDRDFARMLAGAAGSRALRAQSAASLTEALRLVEADSFDVALVDLAPGAESAFALLAELKRAAADTEVVVMSDRTSMAATIQWFDPDAFAFVRKTDVVQLFAAVGRALERRRITAQNRRLVWELQTINEITASLTRSLELEDVLTVALQRLVHAMDAVGGSIRLRDEVSGQFEDRVTIGPPGLRFWPVHGSGARRPSDQVIATRTVAVVEDVAELLGPGAEVPAFRSAISVPLFGGEELLGTLSLASARARRFHTVDHRFLATIGAQIAVAIENAQMHHSILRAKREWEQTVDAIGTPIAVFNASGELLRGNRALAEHLSLPITAMRLLTCGEVGFCGGGPACSVSAALAGRPSRAEVATADGHIYTVMTSPIGLPSAGASVVQIAKDVTDEIRSARRLQQMSNDLAGANGRLIAAMDQLRSTQAQLVQAEKLSAIGHLVAGVAHELNNPLTTVMGYAQLLEEELREGPSDRPADAVSDDLRRIAEESERAARIVRNLLAFARRQSVARVPEDAAELCARVLALREYEFRISGIELQVDLPAGLPLVRADAGQLQQVLLNLVLNAEHAMRGASPRRLRVALRHDAEAGALELTVSDSGHGIDAANLSRVFDPFFTTRDVGEGTGLGLSICYGIVRDHGGHIRVESTPQQGTSFHVQLPACLEALAEGGPRVLVAHPDQSEREFLAAALTGWGYRVTAAVSVDETLAALAEPVVQIALIDRALLVAGAAVWRRLEETAAARRPRLVVTALTLDDPAIEPFVQGETVAVLVPPYDMRALLGALRAREKECV